jgi:hypothetical protein
MSNLPRYSGTQGAKERANNRLDSEEFHYHKEPGRFL